MGKIIHVIYSHDDGCPTLFSRNMADCKCKPDVETKTPKTWEESEKLIRNDFKNWKKERQRYN